MFSACRSARIATRRDVPAFVHLLVLLALALPACTPREEVGGTALARIADREAIEATLQRYTRGLDRLDSALYVSSFAANGVLMIDAKRFQGLDALRTIIADETRLRQSQHSSGQPPRTLFHLEGNSTIEFTSPGRALHQAYWLTASRAGEKPEGLSLLAVGTSTDALEKIDGKWLITRREIRSQP
jgi:hypothetical protein